MGKPTIRNGIVSIPEYIGYRRYTQGTETSKYLKEEKANAIPLVAASETGNSPNQEACLLGL